MAERFLAGLLASFLFTFGAAIFYFQDRFMVLPTAMFTFPTVFVLGLPQSVAIDWLLRPLRSRKRSRVVVLLEALLYAVAGIAATALLLWLLTGELFKGISSFYWLGMTASLLYYACLLALRRQRKKRDTPHAKEAENE